MKRGLLICFEGLDGSGKSTCLRTIARFLEQQQIDFQLTREPGGTPCAEALRKLLLHPWSEDIDPLTELCIVTAARRQHLQHFIIPHLRQGQWIISDRFVDSTYAYQGGGRSVPWEIINTLNSWCVETIVPDRIFFLDAPIECILERMRKKSHDRDRIESLDVDFYHRVRHAYQQRMQTDPERYLVIDARCDAATIACKVVDDLKTLQKI